MPSTDDFTLTPDACRRMTVGMRRGEEAAWREFHEGFLNFLLAYAGSRGVHGADAYDLVQATYLRVLRHVKCFEEVGALKAWLRCLLRCELIDQGRKATRRLTLMEQYAHWVEGRGDPVTSDGGRVDEMLEDLPEGDRRLIKRSCVEGWSHQDLAVEASSTPKAIESKLARLRKRLREEWSSQSENYNR